MENEENIVQKSTRFERAFLRRIIEFATAGFGLVAALAWNDSITAIVKKYIPAGSDLVAKLIYAIVVTLLAVGVTLYLGSLAAKHNLDDEHKHNGK